MFYLYFLCAILNSVVENYLMYSCATPICWELCIAYAVLCSVTRHLTDCAVLYCATQYAVLYAGCEVVNDEKV